MPPIPEVQARLRRIMFQQLTGSVEVWCAAEQNRGGVCVPPCDAVERVREVCDLGGGDEGAVCEGGGREVEGEGRGCWEEEDGEEFWCG